MAKRPLAARLQARASGLRAPCEPRAPPLARCKASRRSAVPGDELAGKSIGFFPLAFEGAELSQISHLALFAIIGRDQSANHGRGSVYTQPGCEESVRNVTPGSSSINVSYLGSDLVEPLSKSELFRNSSLAGCTTEMVCNVTADSGCYSCKVTSEVSENETSLELAISDSSAVVSDGVILGIAVRTAVVSLVMADGDLHSE
ncbi:unnamed protein product [Caretta caretta]